MAKILAAGLLAASLGACGGGSGGGDDDGGGGGSTGGDGDERFDTAGEMTTDTVNDSVNGVVVNNLATGDDPADIHKYTIAATGAYDITLNWDDAANDLDLEIYIEPNLTDEYAESIAQGTIVEQVSIEAADGVPGAVVYIRVLAWDTNGVEQNYTLTVTMP